MRDALSPNIDCALDQKADDGHMWHRLSVHATDGKTYRRDFAGEHGRSTVQSLFRQLVGGGMSDPHTLVDLGFRHAQA